MLLNWLNSIQNIDEDNDQFNIFNTVKFEENKIIYSDSEAITLQTGSYEIEDIESYLIKQLKEKNLSIKANNNILKSTIKFDTTIDFRPAKSIERLLGFTPQILQANKKYT